MGRKRVQFTYDSYDGKILVTFKNNMVVTNDGRCKTIGPSLDVLGYSGFVLEAAKECLEEMLALVDGATTNN
ncbi:hypothetical protein [Clostridium saccharoperbutylacetonicum]